MLRYVAGSDQGCQYGANNVQAFPGSPKKTQRLRRSLYTVYTIHHRSGGESDPVLGGALGKSLLTICICAAAGGTQYSCFGEFVFIT